MSMPANTASSETISSRAPWFGLMPLWMRVISEERGAIVPHAGTCPVRLPG